MRTLTTFVLVIGSLIGLQAQDTLFLDLNTGGLNQPAKVKWGGTVLVKVVGFNPFLYQAELNGTNVELTSDPEGPWKAFVKGDKATETTQAQKEADKAIKSIATSDEKGVPSFEDPSDRDSLASLFNELRSTAGLLDKAYYEVQNQRAFYTSVLALVSDGCMRTDTLLKELRKLAGDTDVMGRSNKALVLLEQAIRDMDVTYSDYLDKADVLGVKPRAIALATPLMKEVEKANELLNDTTFKKEALAAEARFQTAIQKETYELTRIVGQANKDIFKVTYKISFQKDKTAVCSRAQGGEVELWVKGGWRVDWGGGFALGFNAPDEVYELQSDPATEGNKLLIRSADDEVVRPSLIASTYISPRWVSDVRPSMMIGLGADMTDISMSNFYVGLGVLVGRENVLGLHVGPSLMRADRLEKGLEEGRSYTDDELNGKSLTREKLSEGWFLSVTYILRKRK
jgi:hypothetical protein